MTSLDPARVYQRLQHNKKLYQHPYSFYRTAQQFDMTPSQLGKFFAEARRSRSQSPSLRAERSEQLALALKL